MSLAEVKNGSEITIRSMNTASNFTSLLISMGLLPGTKIRVIDNSLKNATLINCKGTRLVLGRGLPSEIEITQ